MGEQVLLVYGSPRRGGNTDLLLDRLAAAFEHAGTPVARLRCADLRVRPCVGCGGCAETGECVIRDDDMPGVYRAVDRAAALVVGSPVYFLGPPAPLKAVIDRFQCHWARVNLLNRRPRRRRAGALLATAGSPSHSVFTCLHRIVDAWFEVLGIEGVANLFLENVDERGRVAEDPRAETDLPAVAHRILERLTA